MGPLLDLLRRHSTVAIPACEASSSLAGHLSRQVTDELFGGRHVEFGGRHVDRQTSNNAARLCSSAQLVCLGLHRSRPCYFPLSILCPARPEARAGSRNDGVTGRAAYRHWSRRLITSISRDAASDALRSFVAAYTDRPGLCRGRSERLGKVRRLPGGISSAP